MQAHDYWTLQTRYGYNSVDEKRNASGLILCNFIIDNSDSPFIASSKFISFSLLTAASSEKGDSSSAEYVNHLLEAFRKFSTTKKNTLRNIRTRPTDTNRYQLNSLVLSFLLHTEAN